MKTAAASELKARLSQYLNQVKAGAEGFITDRSRPVARLVLISMGTHRRGSRLRLEKQGLLRLGSGRLPKGFWALKRPAGPQDLLLRALPEERQEGR